MSLTEDQRRFIWTSFTVSPFVINFVINGLLAFLTYRGRGIVPIWAEDGSAADMVLTIFLIPFLSTFVIIPLVWQSVEQGDQDTVSWTRSEVWWLRWLPRGRWARAGAIGLASVLVYGGLILGILSVIGIEGMGSAATIGFKAFYAGILAAIITPLLALGSLADVSTDRRQTEGAKLSAIPEATLPPESIAAGDGFVQATQNNMIGFVEHIQDEGPLLRIPLFGPVYGYFLNDPDLIREVLVKKADKFQKPFNVKFATRTLNIENLFSSDGELWEKLRAVMQPAFHARRINAYVDIMRDYSEEIVSSWKSGEEIDTPAEMMNLTLATTTRALFGKDMRQDEAGQAIIRFIELFFDRITKLPIPAWVPTTSNQKIKAELKVVFDWLDPLIEERKQDPQAYDDVMAMLIEAQQADQSGLLSDRQISNEVANLFAAGYEVVAHTLVFTLYLVSQHPEVHHKIKQELDTVIGSQPLSLENIGRLTYLEMVLKESMRLLPVTTVLTRQTSERVELGGYILPKDRLILFAPWTLQRNEAHFQDALAFKPERFDPESGEAYHRYAYLPFSSGPRVCIGSAFSMLQMKINLATIWQKFELSYPEDAVFEPIYSFNTRPKDGLPLIVRETTGLAL